MADCHTIGTDVIVQGVFRDATGALVTPSTFSLTYRQPDGTTATIAQGSIDNPSTGVLEPSVPTAGGDAGVWRYRWNVVISGDDLVLSGHFCVCEDGVS